MKKFLPALLFTLACSPIAGVMAADSHDHGSHNSHAANSALTLNNGKKWATDEPLRKGMGNVRNLIEKHVHASHGKAAKNADYDALAKSLQNEVNQIFQNCRLDKKADAALHVILSDVLHGISVLQGKQKAKRADGVTHIAHALENYNTYFDHPKWAALSLH